MTFHDHFSAVAAEYAASRPRYPKALFDFLARATTGHQLVWEAGCGSGQASAGLAADFELVIATDASAEQIANAERVSNVQYSVAAERNPALRDASVDLVAVAQAVHWFDRTVFYNEVERVLRPGGLLAAWTYGLTTITPDVDAIVYPWYRDVLGAYWPPERQLVEDHYRDIRFPYTPLSVPALTMREAWTREQLIAYCATWSAVKEYRLRTGGDALAALIPQLEAVWPDAAPREVRWPLTVLVGGPRR